MERKRKHRIISMLLTVSMMAAMLPGTALAAPPFPDMPEDYSASALEAAVANGLLSGADGKLLPEESLTRAQMAAILTRAFGASKAADLSKFSDVAQSAWYYEELGRAVQMGLFQGGNDGRMNPDAPITRQEAFVVLARAFCLGEGDAGTLARFADAGSVDTWAKGAVAAMIASGFVEGDSGGRLNPSAHIQRKDFAVIMDRMLKTYVTDSTDSLPEGGVMVKAPGVTLRDTVIRGDLVLGDGAGSGAVTLDGVTVTGRTVIRGGASITVKGPSTLGAVNIARAEDGVQFLVEGSAAKLGDVAVAADKVRITSEKAVFRVSVAEGVKGTTVNGTAVTAGNTVSTAKSGASSSSGGGGSGGHEEQPTGTLVNTAAALQDAIERGDTVISLTGDVTGSVVADRPGSESLRINFGRYQLLGGLSLSGAAVTEITLDGGASPAIGGDLTLDLPQATVHNNAAVGGAVNVLAVSRHSLNNTRAIARGVNVQGPGRINSSGDASRATVTVNTDRPVLLGGSIDKIQVAAPSAQASIVGTVTTVSVAESAASSSVSLQGTAKVATLEVNAPNASAEVAGGSVGAVNVTQAAAYSNLTVSGGTVTGAVTMAAAGSGTAVSSGSVGAVNVSESAAGARLRVSNDAQAGSVTVSAPNVTAAVAGQASVTVEQSADGAVVSVEQTAKVSNITIRAANVTASVEQSDITVTIEDSASNAVVEAQANITIDAATSATVKKTDGVTVTDVGQVMQNPLTAYQLTFVANDGTSAATGRLLSAGEAMDTLPAVTRIGYTCKGWYTAASGGGPITKIESADGDARYYAQWEPIQYAITYVKNGGTGDGGPTTYTIESAAELRPLTRAHYTFLGWFGDSGERLEAVPVGSTGDRTLTAQWKIDTHTVTFDNGEGSATAPVTTDYGTALGGKYPAAPTLAGYHFAGWYSDEKLTAPFGSATPVTDDLTIHAKWIDAAKYAVSFESSGGSAVAAQEVAAGDKAAFPAQPEKTGYTFDGWYRDGILTQAWDFSADTVSANTTLYAKWSANTYTVAFDANAGEGALAAVQAAYNVGTKLPKGTLTRAHYAFAGWNTQQDGQGTAYVDEALVKNLSAEAGGTVTLYAQWEEMKISKIAVTAPSAEITEPGGKLQLSAAASPEDALDPAVTWSVDAEAIATIDERGLLTARDNGAVVVKAENVKSGVFGTCVVKISGQHAIGIAMEDFTLRSDASVEAGVNVGWRLSCDMPDRVANVEVSLYSGETLLATNLSKKAENVNQYGQQSTPFVIKSAGFVPGADDWWYYGEWKALDAKLAPTRAVVTVTDVRGARYTGVNEVLTANGYSWAGFVSGAAPGGAWDGKTVDVSWYQAGQDRFTLTGGAQLAGLAKLVGDGNDFAGKTILLGGDIDLGGRPWTPIGKFIKVWGTVRPGFEKTAAGYFGYVHPFSGVFDGDGHTISNLVIPETQNVWRDYDDGAALFGVTSGAVIKNLNVAACNIFSQDRSAAIAGFVIGGGTFQNLTISDGNIRSSWRADKQNSSWATGAIVAQIYHYDNYNYASQGAATVTFDGCKIKHTMVAGDYNVGPMWGSITEAGNSVLMLNQYVEGGEYHFDRGLDTNIVVKNCSVDAETTVQCTKGTVGTLGGWAFCKGVDVTDYANNGKTLKQNQEIQTALYGGSSFYGDKAPATEYTFSVNTTLNGDLTIPEGMTVTVAKGKTLTVAAGKTLTVSGGATLKVLGELEGAGKLAGEGEFIAASEGALRRAITSGFEKVTLGGDFALSDAVALKPGESLALDLNGKTLSVAAGVTANVFTIDGGSLTINDSSAAEAHPYGLGTLKATDVQEQAREDTCVLLLKSGSLTVNGGNFEGYYPENGENRSKAAALCIYGGEAKIHGGRWMGPKANIGGGYYTYTVNQLGGVSSFNNCSIYGEQGALAVGGGIATIDGGDYNSELHYGLYEYAGSDDGVAPTVTVNGGDFNTEQGMSGSGGAATWITGDAKIIVTGGVFGVGNTVVKNAFLYYQTEKNVSYNITGGAFASDVSTLLDGSLYECTKTDDGYTVSPISGVSAMAKIGAIGYSTLQRAADAVVDGETITLLKNCGETVSIGKAVRFTLEPDAYSFTGTINGGTDAWGSTYTVEADGTSYEAALSPLTQEEIGRLNEAFPGLAFAENEEAYPWQVSSTEEGAVALRSSAHANHSFSQIAFSVEGPGTLDLRYRTDCEASQCDGLYFVVDGTLYTNDATAPYGYDGWNEDFGKLVGGRFTLPADGIFQMIGGMSPAVWTEMRIPLTGAGTHTVAFGYFKDSSGAAAGDTVWISGLSFASAADADPKAAPERDDAAEGAPAGQNDPASDIEAAPTPAAEPTTRPEDAPMEPQR